MGAIGSGQELASATATSELHVAGTPRPSRATCAHLELSDLGLSRLTLAWLYLLREPNLV